MQSRVCGREVSTMQSYRPTGEPITPHHLTYSLERLARGGCWCNTQLWLNTLFQFGMCLAATQSVFLIALSPRRHARRTLRNAAAINGPVRCAYPMRLISTRASVEFPQVYKACKLNSE